MGTKLNPGTFDCYERALPDEPMFTLLARDEFAPFFVEKWARQRERDIDVKLRSESDRALVREARECAAAMRQWRANNYPKWRKDDRELDPDLSLRLAKER